ncbi:MAG: hypothetical protein ACT4P6_20710 [Gemmatimonadaceae bacterium]
MTAGIVASCIAPALAAPRITEFVPRRLLASETSDGSELPQLPNAAPTADGLLPAPVRDHGFSNRMNAVWTLLPLVWLIGAALLAARVAAGIVLARRMCRRPSR